MTTKEEIIKVIRQLPDDATLEDAIEKLYLLHKVERGNGQADAGEKISQEEARRQMERKT
ncbi:MAG: hypothetical protein BZY81_06205 [SAR202 cluster bacterium Io17-Chloro-G4]|nr:MAG: hypothetical protein BZY81_06205 [SAR202 cluster bacterium Io17-Chloro-G4]